MITQPVRSLAMCSGLKTKIVANGLQGLMFSVSMGQRTVGLMCPEQQMPLRMIAPCSVATGLASRTRFSLPAHCTPARSTLTLLSAVAACTLGSSLLPSPTLPCPQVLWRLGQDFMAKQSGGS